MRYVWDKGQKLQKCKGWTICWTLGNMCSIAVFNYAGTLFHHDNMIEVLGRNIFSSGITVMKELTATTRAVLDQIRVGDRKY